MHVSALCFQVRVGLFQYFLEDGQLDVLEPLDVDTDSACRMLAQARQQPGVAHRTVHQVDSDPVLPRIEGQCVAIAFPAALVVIVVLIKSDGPDIPQLRLTSADSMHHVHQGTAITNCLLVPKCSNDIVNG